MRLAGTDIPKNSTGSAMTKADNGVWEVTIGPLPPGSYRYNFNVSGVSVIDPRSPAISGSNNNVWSLFHVPGAAFMDTSDVPHGAVAAVTYYSTALRKVRQMHVYTPPGYELGGGKFPVFYLLHGAGDADDSWTSVGRAGFILDNLIAAKKATPMIDVMPTTSQTRVTVPPLPRRPTSRADFVEGRHAGGRKIPGDCDRPPRDRFYLPMGQPDAQHRGGPSRPVHLRRCLSPTDWDVRRLARRGPAPALAYRGAVPIAPNPAWEQQHLAMLDNAAAKKGRSCSGSRPGPKTV